ncbi:MAG: glycoside hydrolase family 9 protein [Cytophagaceae bacterium]
MHAAPGTIDAHIKVDQFGYRCNDQKIAVISNPVTGYNSGSPFTPGTMTYVIKRWSDDVTVFTGTLTAWNGGAAHTQSGDKAWWFDFSGLTTAGSYYVYDATKNVGSYKFDIDDQVYANVLMHSVRSYYYQRCGTALLAANAGAGWPHAACHLGALQDTDCRLYNNTVAGTSKNLSGGWHDAGDYNKYTNFTFETLVNLLLAYQESPSIWKDNYNIPESGNSVPDLLDEVKYELDWLLKMQQADGSVLSIVGNPCSGGGGSPPNTDASNRVYGPATTSASLTAASVFALGAIQYKSLGIPAMTTYSNTLQTAAINAWNWAVANNSTTWNNNSSPCYISAGEQEVAVYDRQARQVCAASFLYVLTGTTTYKTYFDANYSNVHLAAWGFVYPFEITYQDALLYYSKGAAPTAAVVSDINSKYKGSMTGSAQHLPNFLSSTDAYRAFLNDGDYTWGSNSTKAKEGSMFYSMVKYNLDAPNNTNYANAASGYVHYMHGVNPNGFVYLSNMNSYGAENSINEFYHSWFTDGSALWDRVGTSTYGPAPGFVPGGANPGYNVDGCCPTGCGSAAANAQCATGPVTPPIGQPIQKSYKDWNSNWPQDSWSVTENGIYYQAAWVRLLSQFVGGTCTVLPVDYLSFNVSPANESSVLVQWNTAHEDDNSYFMIERSMNTIGFEPAGQVKGSGNSSLIKNYSFTDTEPFAGISYYRLKQVDANGNFSYSEIRKVNRGSASSFLHIFPNPGNGNFTLESDCTLHGNMSLQIHDVTGRSVYEENIPDAPGLLRKTISLPSAVPGMYFLQLKNGNEILRAKIIIQ